MNLADAMQIVLDLAKESHPDEREVRHGNDIERQQMWLEQDEALKTVKDFAVNHLGDD